MRCPKIIGHRANTRAWMNRYIREGADGLEVDASMRGGKVVLGHPPRRTTPATLRERIAMLLTSLHLRKPLRFEYVVEEVRSRNLVLWIDSKSPGLYKALMEYRGLIKGLREVVVSTRIHAEAPRYAKISDNVRVLLSLESVPVNARRLVEESGAHGISINFEVLTPSLLKSLSSEGVLVGIWTLNSPSDLKSILRARIDYVVTDFVRVAKRVCREEGRSADSE